MHGGIAAGHPLTTRTGADVLAAGGNAVDACVAAAFVSWVCEGMLTGPGGGCFCLVHAGGETVVFDAFVVVPRELPGEELVELVVDFDGDTQQRFRTGPAAVAVPGTALGLEAAHLRFGSLPWAELVAPAIRHAREGVELTPAQGYLHKILDPLLRHSPEGDSHFGGRMLQAGDVLASDDLARTLEQIAAEGAGVLYRGGLAEAIAAHVPVTAGDLASYRVVERKPHVVAYRGHQFVTNPPPSSGGELIGVGLHALGDAEPTAEAIVAAMHAQEEARATAVGGTTHISVVDANGDCASLSASLGSGSGVVVPGTGIHMNNMLGEADLIAGARPGERLTSMMAPSVVLRDGHPRLVIGSAGSERLRGAMLQVIANVLGRGMGVREAVDAPRLHVDGELVFVEPGVELEREGLVRFGRQNVFFGGVSAVEVGERGELAAAGDPRRGGAGVVVR